MPGVFTYLGSRNETVGAVYNLHTPQFILDESVLPRGAALHAAMAFEVLKSHSSAQKEKFWLIACFRSDSNSSPCLQCHLLQSGSTTISWLSLVHRVVADLQVLRYSLLSSLEALISYLKEENDDWGISSKSRWSAIWTCGLYSVKLSSSPSLDLHSADSKAISPLPCLIR